MKQRIATLVALIACLSLAVPAGAQSFPDTIPLPDGIQPEGIATGNGAEFFAGSLADGSIYKGDLRTGEVEVLSVQTDRVAVGLDHDPRSDILWVAGGPTGFAHVYDTETGDTIEEIALATSGPTFVNDVIVTRDAAYLTDSFQPQIYEVALDARGLPTGSVETVELSGDFDFVPGDFNANGIDATPRGDTLFVVSSAAAALYTVDPKTGEATEIDLGGDVVANGDGILLDGRALYVVQNFLNQIAVVELSPDLETGEVTGYPTSPDFDIPTTVAEFGNSLYAVNARFATEPGPDVEYDVVRLDKG